MDASTVALLIVGGRAHRAAIDRPRPVHDAVTEHVLSVDVVVATARVLPGNDRPAGAIRYDRVSVGRARPVQKRSAYFEIPGTISRSPSSALTIARITTTA